MEPDPFVGRAAELSLLQGALEQARGGLPRVVLVSGPAGIGKTALVRRFVRDADPVTVLHASGDELESGLDFGVFEQLTRSLDRAQPDPTDTLTVGAELVGLFGALQGAEPLIIVVDDVQWADKPSLHALTFALRRLRTERVLCIAVARDDATSLPEGLRRLVDSGRGLAVRLGGLDATALTALAATVGVRALDPRAVERLREHTDGNPLYARALLEQLDSDVLWHGEGPLPAPSSFSMIVLSRVAGCSVETERLVTAAAVLGRRCPLGVVARMAELDDPLPALEEAVRANLLEAPHAPGAQSVVFPHPLVRAAVYHDLGPARRAHLHARAAELLDLPASLEHRAAAAVEPDPALSAQLEAYASGEGARGAFASAAAHLESAASLSPSPTARDRLLLEAVEWLLRGEDLVAVSALADQVGRLADSPRRLAVLGHLALMRGHYAEAERLLSAAFEDCDHTREPDVAAGAAVQLARVCLAEARGAEAIVWARRASDLQVDDPFVGGLAFGTLVLALGLSGRASEALTLVAALPEGAGRPRVSGGETPWRASVDDSVTPPSGAPQDAGPWVLGGETPWRASVGDSVTPPSGAPTQKMRPEHVVGVTVRGIVRLWTGALTGARADLAATTSAAWSQRLSGLQVMGLGCLAAAEYHLGFWDDSLTHAAAAVSLTEVTDRCCFTPTGDAVSAWVLAARGDWGAAQAHVRAAKSAVGAQSVVGTTTAASAAALVAYARGDHDAVVRAVQPILGLRHRDGIDEPGVFLWREHYADALASLGRLDEAEAALTPFEALACERGRQSAMANAARVRGNLEAARGNDVLARAAFERGLRHLDGLPFPLDHARLHHAYGQFLRRAGERTAAARELAVGRETCAALGARPLLERCEHELAVCGLSPARGSSAARLDLTPQEQAVAHLVTTGLTNRQVAAELVISAKTVEYHLGNIYAKLGLTSRTQLAAYLNGSARLGAERPPRWP
ncbi:MAG: helix-turn-helix transcriptional regulator [Egibacteraceae bacterium]